MPQSVLLDAGPLVAFLHEDEQTHDWAVAQFKRFSQFTTCEAVLAEACARLNYYGKNQRNVIDLVRQRFGSVDFDLNENADRVSRLLIKYADQPMDLLAENLKTLGARGIAGFTDIFKHYETHAPLKRNVLSEELGAAGLFLASDGAAAITGQVIYVDAAYEIMGM